MRTGFGHFLEFGTSDGLEIAYYDSAKLLSTFGHGNRSCIINEVCIISIIYAKKAKNEVFVRFLENMVSVFMKLHQNPLLMILFDCVKVADSA